MLQKLELSRAAHYELIAYCKQKNINFFSTAFDLESLEFLKELGAELFKIPSGEITNLPYLKKVAELASEIILSTGMSTMEEIGEALEVLRKYSKAKITVLHCNTEYPTPFSDVNYVRWIILKINTRWRWILRSHLRYRSTNRCSCDWARR
jgi:sialic acid synthase SpsE